MRKIYLFALLALMVFVFAGTVIAEPQSIEQEKALEENLARTRISLPDLLLQNRTSLDETVIYETTFENADDWTVEDGSSDGYTWVLSDTAQQVDRPMFRNGPFMWVDSDESPDETHLTEGLISPTVDPGTFAYIYMMFDLEYNDYTANDVFTIQYTNDNGTNWTDLGSYTEDIQAYPFIMEVTDVAANNGPFQIRFLYDDGGDWAWYAGVDNFSIVGSDVVLDLEPPVIEITDAPESGFVGMDREILAIATDDAAIASVTLQYGIVVNDDVPDILTTAMTATGNENEFSGIIPGDFGVEGDTIAFVAVVEDAAGNTTADPAEAGSAYIFNLYPIESAYQVIEMPTYDWLEVSTTGTDLNMGDSDIQGFAFADFGLGTFTYFGVEYDSVYVNSNGWLCFEAGARSYTSTPSLPDDDEPNATIVMCGDDLDAEDIGDVYVGAVDGKFVAQWGDANGGCVFWLKDFGPKGQIVLDMDLNVAYINYEIISGFEFEGEPYTGSHIMGIENPDGIIADVLYSGSDFTFPVNQTSYVVTPPAGDLTGFVYESDGTTPVVGAEINLLRANGTDVLMTAISGDDGSYEFPILIMGTYDIEVVAAGFVTSIVEDIVVGIGESITHDFSLEVQTLTTTVQGYVHNADAAENTGVAGIDVYLVQYDMTATTDGNGFFSFGDLAIGTFHFMVGATPEGSTGFHNAIYPRIHVVENNPDINFDIFEVLAPANLIATPGEISVSLAWDAPENHMTEEMLVQRINDRREMLNVIDANPTAADLEKAQPYRQELARLERRLAYLNQLNDEEAEVELDDISLFQNYIVSVDDEVVAITQDEEYLVYGLTNGTDYNFKVAADYGYGNENLVWTDVVTVAPNGIYIVDFNRDFEWIDISTTGTALNLEDDGTSGALPLGGMIVEHFGVMYSEFYVSANGMIMFLPPEEGARNLSDPIPEEDLPNAVVAPYWDDFDPADSDAENIYYQIDQENERVIIQWHTGPYPGPNTNVHDFELILYPNLGEYVFSYLHSVEEWDIQNTSIGYENETGTLGLALNPETVITDSTSIMIGFTIPPRGTISGNVVSSDGMNIEGAEIWLEGLAYPVAVTGNDGTFGPATVQTGTHDFTVVHNDFWSVQVEDIVVNEEQNTVIPEVSMTYPDPRVSPSSLDLTFDLDNDDYITETFELFNDGSGPLEYFAAVNIASSASSSRSDHPVATREIPAEHKTLKSTRVDANSGPVVSTQLDEAWDLITSYPDIEMDTGSQDNLGVAITESMFYVSGYYGGTLTSFNYDGSYVDQVDYPAEVGGDTYSGLFDLSSDNDGYLYGGDESGNLYKFRPDMSEFTEVGAIDEFFAVSVAYDYDNHVIYTSSFGDPFYAVDNNGNATSLTPSSYAIYGMAYVPMDEEGYTIYAHADNEMNSFIIRYNPSTDQWDETPVQVIYDTSHEDDVAGGMASGVSSSGNFEFMTLKQDQNMDQADRWEGYSAQQWLTVSPADGTVLSGGSQQLTIVINPSADPNFGIQGGDEITSFIRITGPHMDDIVVLVTISFAAGAGETVSDLPSEYVLHQNYPNPFNPTTEIKFDLVESQSVKLVVFNMLGQEVTRLVDAPMQAGYHVVTFDASTLASGVYFYRIETEAFTSMKKMVMVK